MTAKKVNPKPLDVFLVGELDDTITREFQHELRDAVKELEPTQSIRVNISCDGGPIELTLAICSQIHQLRRQGYHIITHASSGAYSGGASILQAGSHRTIEPYAHVMMHGPQLSLSTWEGDAIEFKAYFEAVQQITEKLIGIIADRSGLDQEWIRANLFSGGDNYFDAITALEHNLVDEILTTP